MLRAVSQVPVIVASARDDDPSLVAALDAGADDYVVKPYTTAQLEARIRAVLRRAGARPDRRPRPWWSAGLSIDVASRRGRRSAASRSTSRRASSTCWRYLAAGAGEVVTKRELLAEVWQQPYGGADKTVDVHLSWLRRKLGETAAEPRYLHVGARRRRTAGRPGGVRPPCGAA